MEKGSYIIGKNRYQAAALEAALYLVSTPIGNLGDITLRALETLAEADIVACEDTRVTRVLLTRFALTPKLVTYQEHNAAKAGAALIDALKAGKSVALVSDAGTPLLSDPGFRLVEEARAAGIKVVPVPGASALLAALVGGGLPTDEFFFCGFLSAKTGERRKKLESLKHQQGTLIIYEAPHRVVQTLHDMAAIFGGARQAVLARELTKKFETFDSAPLAELAARYDEETRVRGEIVLLLAPLDAQEQAISEEEVDRLLLELSQTMPAAKAAGEAAKMTGQKKQALYQRLLCLKDEEGQNKP